MFTFKILVIIFLQTCLLVKENTARVRHIDAYIGKSMDKNCDCGIPHFKPEQVLEGNGTVSHWRRYPWMVGMVYNGKIVCGGSLIDTQYVLTAAHCLDRAKKMNWNMSEIQIALNVFHTTQRMVTIGIDSYFIHPIYDENNHDNDIAIIRLEKPVFYTKWLRPICLSVDPKMSRNGTMVQVIGYGYTIPGANKSAVLREVSLPIKDLEDCREKLNTTVLETAICAGGLKGEDACEGDSGSPMFYIDSEDRSYQVGIVSWGRGCGSEDRPAIYTRINTFIHWIRNTTADSPSCEILFPPLVGPNIEDCGIPEEKCKKNGTICNTGESTYSWMVRIFYKEQYLGSGILVNRTIIITTTRTISPWRKFKKISDLRVILGMRKLEDDENDTGELECGVSYAEYHIRLKQVPIVILNLDLKSRDLTLLHRPICMPSLNTNRDRTGENVILMFWKEKKIQSKKSEEKNRKKSKREQRKEEIDKTPKNTSEQYNIRRRKMELMVEFVEIVKIKRCRIHPSLKGRVICGVVKGENRCHENGAILINYVNGRVYILGVVSPTTKKCSKVKKFMDISWNYRWLYPITEALRFTH